MPLPRFITLRGDTYYVRRPIPLDLQPAFGRKEIQRSLRTARLAEAKARSHGVLAAMEAEFEAKRREMRAGDEERAFLASGRATGALREVGRITASMAAGLAYAPVPETPEDAELIALGVRTGWLQPRSASRAEAARQAEHALAELEVERAGQTLVTAVDGDGTPLFGSLPDRYAAKVQAFIEE